MEYSFYRNYKYGRYEKLQSITEEDENIDVVKIFNDELKDGLNFEFDENFLMIGNF